MNLDLQTVRRILAPAAALFVAVELYRRWARIVSFQKGELTRGAPLAKSRVAAAGAAVLLLVIVGIVAVAGASTTVVYALLFVMVGCVILYLVLLGAASFRERTGRDRQPPP